MGLLVNRAAARIDSVRVPIPTSIAGHRRLATTKLEPRPPLLWAMKLGLRVACLEAHDKLRATAISLRHAAVHDAVDGRMLKRA